MDKICSGCNKVLSENVAFCPGCGVASSNSMSGWETHQVSPQPQTQSTQQIPQSQSPTQAMGATPVPQTYLPQPMKQPQHQYAPTLTTPSAVPVPSVPPIAATQPTTPPTAATQSTTPPSAAPPPIRTAYTPLPQASPPQTVRHPQQYPPAATTSPMTYTQASAPQAYVPYRHPQQIAKKSRKLPIVLGIIGGAIGGIILFIAIIVALTSDNGDTTRVSNGSSNDRAGTTITERQIPAAPPNLAELSPEQIFEDNVDAVFILYTYDANWNPLGSGSGFFISQCGIAVTNHHVVVGAQNALVITESGDEFYVIGFYSYDVSNDLAVIKVAGEGFSYLYIGDSEIVRVGESVYAIGSPHGHQNTFSISYVSSIVSEVFFDIYTIEGMIQITAPIYAGSSGGALLNSRGEVIGVTTATDPRRANIGYAVPTSRLDVSVAERGVLSELPIGDDRRVPGEDEIFFYARFPSIPDFQSVSSTATLVIGGSAEDMDFSVGEEFDFEYVYLYELAGRHFIPDTDIYDIVLSEHGFAMQTVQLIDTRTYVYLYNSEQNVSLVYTYFWDIETFLVAIGQGNAFEELFANYVDREGEALSLLGGWSSDTVSLHYFSDGTGSARFYIAGTDTLDYEEEFLWRSDEPGLMTYITGPFAGTTWNFLVVGDRITFTDVNSDLIAIFDRIS